MYFYLWPFLPTYRSLINISCKAYLVVLNSSSICLFVKCLHSLSNLNDSHAKQSILGCGLFYFHHFKYIMPLSSGLQSFCWKVSYCFFGSSRMYNKLLFPCFLKIFFCFCWHFNYKCVFVWTSVGWSYLGPSVIPGPGCLFPFPG